MRVVAVFCGVMGAASLAQFPEFSQQYLQRLAGKVEGLQLVTAQFDGTAAASGLSREGALRQLGGTDLLDHQQADMRATFAAEQRLAADLARLRGATPLQRLTLVRSLSDPDLLEATYADYRPAMPTTADGLICAAFGYGLAWTLAATLLALLRRALGGLWRRKQA